MSGRLAHLATRVFNTPLLMHPGKLDIIMAALAERFGVVSLDNFAPRPQTYFDDESKAITGPSDLPPHAYDTVQGVAVIDVCGTLVNNLGTVHAYSGMCGYDGIRQNYACALDDPDVKGIALKVASGGGEVAGCFDTTDYIFAARNKKPSIAILDESAYSAAYALASACTDVVIPRTGGAGSVGVIAMHVDFSKAIKSAGMKVKFITYGAKKADGHPELPLSPMAEADWQETVNTMGEIFVNTVARNRGLSAEAIIDMQAGCYMGQKAVDAGLADYVSSPDAAFAAFVASLK